MLHGANCWSETGRAGPSQTPGTAIRVMSSSLSLCCGIRLTPQEAITAGCILVKSVKEAKFGLCIIK